MEDVDSRFDKYKLGSAFKENLMDTISRVAPRSRIGLRAYEPTYYFGSPSRLDNIERESISRKLERAILEASPGTKRSILGRNRDLVHHLGERNFLPSYNNWQNVLAEIEDINEDNRERMVL